MCPSLTSACIPPLQLTRCNVQLKHTVFPFITLSSAYLCSLTYLYSTIFNLLLIILVLNIRNDNISHLLTVSLSDAVCSHFICSYKCSVLLTSNDSVSNNCYYWKIISIHLMTSQLVGNSQIAIDFQILLLVQLNLPFQTLTHLKGCSYIGILAGTTSQICCHQW